MSAPLREGPVGLPDGQFVLVEWADPGGETGPERPIAGLHVHHEDDEAWYVLEGRLGFRLGDEVVEAGRGECVLARRGVAHSYWNASPEPAHYVLVMTPRTHALIEALHGPREDPADWASIFREHASELLD